MNRRWIILAVLFFVRSMMAFQYQSVAALSPALIATYVMSIAEIGLLIGLYLGPGILVARPGGQIAARFGDKRVTSAGVLMMLAGAVIMALAPDWNMLAAGRVISGVGGVVVNVVLTKMIADWFAGREIGTAMGIVVSAWPVGIAFSLLLLPWLNAYDGLGTAHTALALLIGLALVTLLVVYTDPPGQNDTTAGTQGGPLPWWPLMSAALLWAVYNAGIAMVFAFGPLLLNQQGMAPEASGQVISGFMFALAIGVPLGGIISDKTGRRDQVIAFSLVLSAAGLLVLVSPPAGLVPVAYAIVGLMFGLAAGPVMTMPSSVLPPEIRARGLGTFFTMYYAIMMVAPIVAGALAEATGGPAVTYWFGAAMLAFCLLCLWQFRMMTRPPAEAGH